MTSPHAIGTQNPTRFVLLEERAQLPLHPKPFHQWIFADGTPWASFYRHGADYLLRFPQLADFQVSADGTGVQCRPAPGVSSATTLHLHMNQVLPLALSRQGKLVLHASAVETDGAAAAFIGMSGRGKSTLAASFATSGYAFLTDDGLQIEWGEDHPLVAPSHPSIRLWEDSRSALLSAGTMAAPALEYTSKSRFLAGPGIAFCDQPRALQRVYFLGPGLAERPMIEPARPAVALMELVRHSFLLDIDEQAMLARHFDELSRIANLPLHYHLDYPRRYQELETVREAILAHAKQCHRDESVRVT